MLSRLYRYADLDSLLLYSPPSFDSSPLGHFLTLLARERKDALNTLLQQTVQVQDHLGALCLHRPSLHRADSGLQASLLSRCCWLFTGYTLRKARLRTALQFLQRDFTHPKLESLERGMLLQHTLPDAFHLFMDLPRLKLKSMEVTVSEAAHMYTYGDLFEVAFQRRVGQEGTWQYSIEPRADRVQGKFAGLQSSLPQLSRNGVPLSNLKGAPFCRYSDSLGFWTVRLKPSRSLLFD